MALTILPSKNDAEESHQAITEHYLERLWGESKLSSGVSGRLLRVERALHAMNTINSMLLADALGKADKAENGAIYDGISPIDVEGLRCALTELGTVAAVELEEIRDNYLGCVA